ncbi:MAG TPA: hypothetical protein VG223_06545 [Solirubrobacteraceae bacterium]|nr:hypothetical protein [Solirubrobacteraceae bacterium]
MQLAAVGLRQQPDDRAVDLEYIAPVPAQLVEILVGVVLQLVEERRRPERAEPTRGHCHDAVV